LKVFAKANILTFSTGLRKLLTLAVRTLSPFNKKAFFNPEELEKAEDLIIEKTRSRNIL
jgi:hypothetical protein